MTEYVSPDDVLLQKLHEIAEMDSEFWAGCENLREKVRQCTDTSLLDTLNREDFSMLFLILVTDISVQELMTKRTDYQTSLTQIQKMQTDLKALYADCDCRRQMYDRMMSEEAIRYMLTVPPNCPPV